MKTNLHHVSLFSNDLDRSLLLFKDLLGFDELWRVGPLGGPGMAALFGLEDIKAELVMLKSREGLLLELIRLLNPRLEKTPGPPALPAPASLCLEVADLDGLHQRLGEEGWPPFTPVAQLPTPTGEMTRMFCIRTQENVLLEFVQAPGS